MSYGNYPDLDKVKKVLIVKLRHLGDVLLSTPIYSILKNRAPNAQIDLYINEEALDIVKNNPYINGIILFDRKMKKKGFFKKIVYERKLLKKIKKNNYDLIINLTEGDRGDIAAFFSKAKIKVGFQKDKKSIFKSKSQYIVKNSFKHNVEKNLDALRIIGIFPEENEKELFFQIQESLSLKVRENLKDQNIDPDNFILIHPASRWRFKCWDKFNELISILEKRGENIVISSSNDLNEINMCCEICKNSKAFNLAGKTSIDELAILISLSKMLISVDSLPLHLASALNKRAVVIFGPTSDIIWGPWQNEKIDIVKMDLPCRPCSLDGCAGSKFSDCLHRISVDKVLNAIDKKFIEKSLPKAFSKGRL